ncbi:phenazine-specific anthranilate synthase component I, partial [Streptomyces sp. NPDC059956]
MTGTGRTAAGTGTTADPDLLARVLDGSVGAFALLYRPESTAPGTLEVLLGHTATCATLADLPLTEPRVPADPKGHDTAPTAPAGGGELLALVPYRQITERGYAALDDGEPLIALTVTDRQNLPLATALRRLPDDPVKVEAEEFDLSDEAYADLVRRVVADEIGSGEGANFVIKRTFTAWLPDCSVVGALSFFRRLLEREAGAYWTFLVHTGDRMLIGATPERHISVRGGTAVMNPI